MDRKTGQLAAKEECQTWKKNFGSIKYEARVNMKFTTICNWVSD